MGPSPRLSPLFKKLDDLKICPNFNYLQYTINNLPARSWYFYPPLDSLHVLGNQARLTNNHTLLISEKVHVSFNGIHFDPNVKMALDSRRDFKYNFHDLVNFPALKTLVVMISRQELIPKDPKKHIVHKTLGVVKNKYPSFNVPEVEFRFAY